MAGRAGVIALLIDGLPIIHKPLAWSPALHRPVVVVHACNSSIWEVVSYIQSLRSAWVRGSLREAAGVAGHIRVHFVLITVAGEWIQPRCPSTEGWIEKMWCIYTMGFYSAV